MKSYEGNLFGSTGFLCDWQPGYGTLQCTTGENRCPGATYGSCLPQGIWSSKQIGDAFAWSPELLSGSFYEWRGEGGHELVFAFGVRCVLELDAFIGVSLSYMTHIPVTAPCSVFLVMEAARVLIVVTATYIAYGLLTQWTETRRLAEGSAYTMAVYARQACAMATVSVLVPGHFLCAVSWS